MRVEKLIIAFILVYATLVGCSVLIIKNSHGNTINDLTTPDVDANAQIQALGKGNSMTEDKPTKDTIK